MPVAQASVSNVSPAPATKGHANVPTIWGVTEIPSDRQWVCPSCNILNIASDSILSAYPHLSGAPCGICKEPLPTMASDPSWICRICNTDKGLSCYRSLTCAATPECRAMASSRSGFCTALVPFRAFTRVWARSKPSRDGQQLLRIERDSVVGLWAVCGDWARHEKGWTLLQDDQGPLLQDISLNLQGLQVHCLLSPL